MHGGAQVRTPGSVSGPLRIEHGGWLGALVVIVCVLTSGAALRSAVERFQPFPSTGSESDALRAKNFPLVSLLDRHPEAQRAIADAPALRALLDQRRTRVATAARECAVDIGCHATTFILTADDVAQVSDVLAALVRNGQAMTALVDEMRGSGLFAPDRDAEPAVLMARAWQRTAAGLNRIIAVYGRGEPPRYPAIDAVSHDVASPQFGALINTAVGAIEEGGRDWRMFFEPSLAFALTLLDVSRRDEAGRFEPLHLGENAAAYQHIASIRWSDFPYPAIVVPGAGADSPDVVLDPQGKLRVALAARRYHDGTAPLLLVSGGNVHPNQTRFNEALEMKRSLMRDFQVPERAILIDPHARHTTTNLRNAARLLFRYGVPTDRPSLITTDQYQSSYIEGALFAERCEKELGYQPYQLKARLSRYDVEWLASVEALRMDPLDPLDP